MSENDDSSANVKKLHPFFSAPKSIAPQTPTPTVAPPVTPDPSCSPASEKASEKPEVIAIIDDESESVQGRQKRRKTESVAEPKVPGKRGRPKGKTRGKALVISNIANLFSQKDGFDNDSGGVDRVQDSEAGGTDAEQCQTSNAPQVALAPPIADQALQQNDHQTHQQPQASEPPSSKPVKLLKFNPKTGTIGSPPKPKAPPIEEVVSNDKPAVRPRRSKKPTSLIVSIQYGGDPTSRTHIGERIEEITSGVRRVFAFEAQVTNAPSSAQQSTPPTSSQDTPKKRAPKKGHATKKAKMAHPFFTSAKTDAAPAAAAAAVNAKELPKSPVKRQSIFTSTPCSPRRIRQQTTKFNFPQFGNKSGVFKFPGAQQAAWPWKGTAHIRNDERDLDTATNHDLDLQSANSSSKKAKGRVVECPAGQSVLGLVEDQLGLPQLEKELKTLNIEDFLPPPATLQVPERHFESGKRLQIRIAPELRTINHGDNAKTHPAIATGFASLTKTLTAFDRSTCESTAWAQKYSPAKAEQVLQVGREAELLRDWLQTLKVQAVDTGASDSNSISAKTAPAKRKKRRKLDNFVVSSDEDEILMDENSDDESAWLPNGAQGVAKRTVVRRPLSKDTRLTNAVLLSGPHGCGKTAAVYAIAKELDFEIFEISPGARRSGKDIIERIGDMTRNHQVSHKQEEPKLDEGIDEDEVARDISSGKQGMMTTFFKPKASLPAKPVEKKPLKEVEIPATEKLLRKAPSKSQKQSLILLEEVDILYEEDKQFWATVISLMAQSKRPFIMTCNNERLVPIQSLNLHGIFRFTAAPKCLAVDHLLLIAANEGHALDREAVTALYDSRQNDLRAAIAELHYWCQIGIGDPRGGFGWFYRTWPKGSDLDKDGERIRVVSAHTYRKGMGWLGRDAISEAPTTSSVEEEIVHQAWESWGYDAGDRGTLWSEHETANITNTAQLSHKGRLELLDAADTFYDDLSAADLISQGAFSSLNQITLDPTQPDLPSKSRDDFIIGLQLIDAPTLSQYDTTAFAMATKIRNLAQAQLSQPHLPVVDTMQLDKITAVQKLHENFKNPLSYHPEITRHDYSLAFDPIAVSDKPPAHAGHLDPSVFDRTFSMIILDVAPYVRSIVAYDQRLQTERLLRSNILSEGGKPQKRMRSTRSAWSALEGGSRASTRRDKYFSADVNSHLVMRTGGKGWELLAADVSSENEDQKSQTSSSTSADELASL